MRSVKAVLAVVLMAETVGACGSSTTASASPVAQLAHVTVRIEGMACDACAGRIEEELREVDGVAKVVVVFDEKRAEVAYDPQRVTPRRMLEAVEELGFAGSVGSVAD